MATENRVDMTLLGRVSEALAGWPQAREVGQRIAVPTLVLYGSGGVVRVYVEGGVNEFVVHDGGGAIDQFSNCGGSFPNTEKLVRSHLHGQGFVVTAEGYISSPKVDFSERASAIALVANASRDVSEFLIDRWKPVIRRDFKKALRELLEAEFPHLKRQVRKVGESNKAHRFDFMLPTPDGGELLVDAVAHEQSAITSSVVKNLDVSRANPAGIVQRVIYDDSQQWSAEDLNILRIGAVPIRFSQAQTVLERLAAA